MTRSWIASTLLLLTPAAAVAAPALFPSPIVIVQKIESSRGDTVSLTRYLSGNRMKTVSESKGRQAVRIVDFANKQIFLVDPANKKFSKVTFDQLEKRYEEGWVKFRQLPAEEQSKKRALAIALPPTKVKPTDEYETIAGFKARKYEVSVDGRDQTLWASSDFVLPAEIDQVEDLFLPYSGPIGDAIRENRKPLREIPGFLLRRVESKGPPNDTFTETTDTIEVRRDEAIPDSELEVPKGYAEVDAGAQQSEKVARVNVPPPTVRAASASRRDQ